ncbi:glycosyltransferase family 2 protein [Corynebacterium sp.]|uniref:glycosyltransferase family 2 protein n=1 Tax=Corynebacterium sp. TaxID=1720 RepID=UPI0037353488
MKVSVVIPCFNDAVFLKRVLHALHRQSLRPHQIIVVDNNSIDDSVAVASTFPDVEVLHEPEQGILPAATTGYNAATGDVIARIDADTLPPTNFIADLTRMWQQIGASSHFAPKRVVAATGNATFDWPGRWGSVISRAYLGAYYATTRSALGHYPLFGTNFSMLTSWWHDVRGTIDMTVHDIHDDLHLSFAVRPDETVWYQQDLHVQMDSRALVGIAQLTRRFWRGFRTMRINFRRQSPPVRLAQRGLLKHAGSTP